MPVVLRVLLAVAVLAAGAGLMVQPWEHWFGASPDSCPHLAPDDVEGHRACHARKADLRLLAGGFQFGLPAILLLTYTWWHNPRPQMPHKLVGTVLAPISTPATLIGGAFAWITITGAFGRGQEWAGVLVICGILALVAALAWVRGPLRST